MNFLITTTIEFLIIFRLSNNKLDKNVLVKLCLTVSCTKLQTTTSVEFDLVLHSKR